MARKQGSNISVFEIQRSFVFCIQLLHLGLWAHCSGIDSDTIRCVIPAVITRDQGNILLQFAQKGRRNGLVMSSTVKCICPKSGRLHLRYGTKSRFIIRLSVWMRSLLCQTIYMESLLLTDLSEHR